MKGSSRSFNIIDVDIDVDSPRKHVSSTSYNKQHVCAHLQLFFIASQVNSGKISTFNVRVPLFHALVQGEPPHPEAQNFVTKN